MVGLGRLIGGGSDMVLLWSPGMNGAAEAAGAALRVVCLLALLAPTESLMALRIVAETLMADRTVAEAFLAGRSTAEALDALRAPATALLTTIKREC